MVVQHRGCGRSCDREHADQQVLGASEQRSVRVPSHFVPSKSGYSSGRSIKRAVEWVKISCQELF